MKEFIFPKTIKGNEIKKIRKELNLTRKELGLFLNVADKTIERWENSKEPLNISTIATLKILKNHKELLNEYLLPERKTINRILWKKGDDILTVIDPDYIHSKVTVKNYTDNINLRAFGLNKNPTIEDLESFLESRCTPKTRDGIKSYLKSIDVPCYDPYLIIKKTGGRSVEDDFYLEVIDD